MATQSPAVAGQEALAEGEACEAHGNRARASICYERASVLLCEAAVRCTDLTTRSALESIATFSRTKAQTLRGDRREDSRNNTT